ncbi:MAG: GCN5-related N-acetyltransferase [Hyphomonadaceae bacterium]|nr:MAG: GCN5-related N-acetyltransferase [Hyphomonadaceae bacterium]
MPPTLRTATSSDIPQIAALIELSVNGLQVDDYSPTQRAAALGSVFGIDTNLIGDGTYLIAELNGQMVGCGGWSMRQAMFGADSLASSQSGFLDPTIDAARIRAFFVHPDFARRGIGAKILLACENAASNAGFKRFELGSTLTGIPLYSAYGYTPIKRIDTPLPNGETLPIVLMGKNL